MIPATDSTANTLAAKLKKDFKSVQSCKIISKMPKPLLGVSKLLHLPDTSAPLICPFAPPPFPIPNSPWKAVHRLQPKKTHRHGWILCCWKIFQGWKGLWGLGRRTWGGCQGQHTKESYTKQTPRKLQS